MTETHGIFERDLTQLTGEERSRLKQLEEKNQQLQEKLESRTSSHPGYHRVLRKRYRAYQQIADFKNKLDAKYPAWRHESEGLKP